MSVQSFGMETIRVGRTGLAGYIGALWRYRHLMFHLASADLQSRFRRSTLGVLWAMVHPLAFALLYSLVLANLFQQDFRALSIYVFAGFILWESLAGFANQGAHAIINGTGYLKQAPIPMILFPMRTSLTVLAVLLLGFCALFLYRTGVIVAFKQPEPILTLSWLWVAPIFAMTFLMGTAWATIVAFMNVKFRDTQQLLQIALQALWFASPIFFPRELFNAPQLQLWSTINPVVAFLDAFRDATLYDRAPELKDWIVMGVATAGSWAVAIVVTALNDRKSIHYV